MNPTFGANLKDFIFEATANSTTEAMESRIRDNIAIEFPQVVIESITFKNEPDRNFINFILTYNIKDSDENDELNIELQ